MISAKRIKKRDINLIIWCLPFIALVIAFSYVPLFGWLYAFFDYQIGIPLFKNQFEGFKNFIEIFNSTGEIYGVLINTLAMNFLNLLVSPLPVIFAIMLNEIRNPVFKRITQTVTTIPNFISWIIVYSLAFSMFSSEGVVNQLLDALHSNITVDWMNNMEATWYFQTAIGIWKSLGWTSIIYIAAMTGIDSSLYDAAKVDGAGFLSQVRHITIPGIMPTFIVLMLLSIANMVSSNFDQYFVFYNSVVAEKIEVVDYYAYRIGFMMNDYSLGTAVSATKSVVSVTLLFFVNYLSKITRGESII